jgi:Nucleoside 2-deoxyribosyltransferase like
MYIQSPDNLDLAKLNTQIFLAGGISNCPNWQDIVVTLVNTDRYDLINPRRKGHFETWGDIAAEQIAWEHDALNRCTAVLFWFPKDTLCPITLFEIGKQLAYVGQEVVDRRLIIGWDPEYARAFDLEQQIKLEVKHNPDARYNVRYYGPGWDNFCATVQKYYG